MKSRSPFRALLLTTGAIAVLAVAGFVVASAALDPAHLRAELQEAVARATGRALTVSGGVHIRLGLSPRLEVDDVALANIPGGSAPNMLTARSMTAQLALLPLLSGDAVISSLSLQDPNILLERAPDGTGNWQFAGQRHALYHATATSSGGGGGHHSVEIRTIHLRGGQITWRGAPGPAVILGISALDWSANDIDAPMTFSFSGTHGDAPLNISATSGSLQRLQGGPVSALAGTWPLTLDLTSDGASLRLSGGVNHPAQWRNYTFRVTANAPVLASVSPMLGLGSLPPLADVNATAVLQDSPSGELRTSQLSVHAGQSDLSTWIPGLAVHQLLLSAPGPGQLAQLSVDGTYQQQPLRVAATATQPDVIGGAAPVQVTLTAAAAGATASAHGTIPPAWNTAGLDLAVQFKAPDLSALSPLAGRSLPAAHDVSVSAQVQDAGVKLRGVSVHDLVASSSIGDLSGQLSVQWAPRTAFTGTLTSRMLDLDAIGVSGSGLLPAVWPPATGGDQVQPPPSQNAALASSALPPATDGATPTPITLPLARLRTTDADVMLNVGALTVSGQHLSDVQAHLQLALGKLALNPFRAQSAEGAIIGGVSIDASSDDPPVAVTLRSPSISADTLAGLLGYPGGAHGTMQVNAELSGTGQTAAALKATLDGHLGLAMVNGQVSDSLLQGLIGAALDASGVPAMGDGTNQVRCFASRIDFAAGVGTLRALSVDTSRLVLDGSGTIDLQSQTAHLHLRPRVRLGPTEVAAPVSLSGPLGALRATLDPVLGGGRVGISIGRSGGGGSGCASQLALARGGLPGPLPPAAASSQPVDPGLVIRKPKDLLKGLFH